MTSRLRIFLWATLGAVVVAGITTYWLADHIFQDPSRAINLRAFIGVLVLGIGILLLVGLAIVAPRAGRVMLMLASMLSLLLLMTSVVGWVQSYRFYTSIQWIGYHDATHEDRQMWLFSARGAARIWVTYIPDAPPVDRRGWIYMSLPASIFRPRTLAAGLSPNSMTFAMAWEGSSSGGYVVGPTVPWWFLAVIFLLLPLWHGTLVYRRIRRKRLEATQGSFQKPPDLGKGEGQ